MSNKYDYNIRPFMEELHSDDGWPKFRRVRDALAAEAAVDILDQLTREFVKEKRQIAFAAWLLDAGQPVKRPSALADGYYWYYSFFYRFTWGEKLAHELNQSIPYVDSNELLAEELAKVVKSHGLSAYCSTEHNEAIVIGPGIRL